MIPNGDEFVEQPLPEQFRTQVSHLKYLGKLHLHRDVKEDSKNDA